MSSLSMNPGSISEVMTIVFACGDPGGERLYPAFALQRHSDLTAGVIVWGAIAYNTRSPLENFQFGNRCAAYFNPPTEQHGFFHPTREASKTDHTEFFLRPGTHQK
ncbi:hypothetical protein TNCV_2970951 [Trichonephila clavipes]|nr:hypothetical protein TNCV_2970951 [Trichonephila clavipes]